MHDCRGFVECAPPGAAECDLGGGGEDGYAGLPRVRHTQQGGGPFLRAVQDDAVSRALCALWKPPAPLWCPLLLALRPRARCAGRNTWARKGPVTRFRR